MPAAALEMERELLHRAIEREDSLISNHPRLAPELSRLAQRCRDERVVVYVMLARAYGETQGIFAVHWIARGLPPYVRRAGFYSYWSSAGPALAASRQRARVERGLDELRRRLVTDPLTGLPNGTALDQYLHEHVETAPLVRNSCSANTACDAAAASVSVPAQAVRSWYRSYTKHIREVTLLGRVGVAGQITDMRLVIYARTSTQNGQDFPGCPSRRLRRVGDSPRA